MLQQSLGNERVYATIFSLKTFIAASDIFLSGLKLISLAFTSTGNEGDYLALREITPVGMRHPQQLDSWLAINREIQGGEFNHRVTDTDPGGRHRDVVKDCCYLGNAGQHDAAVKELDIFRVNNGRIVIVHDIWQIQVRIVKIPKGDCADGGKGLIGQRNALDGAEMQVDANGQKSCYGYQESDEKAGPDRRSDHLPEAVLNNH